jgi:hypothetical protein
MNTSIAHLRRTEARYQRASENFKLAEQARNDAIRAARTSMSTREIAKHVSITAARVHQLGL